MTDANQTELRSLIDTWMEAVRRRDVDAITAPYADDILAFDAIQSLQFKGKAAYRAHWEMCMGFCTGPMVFQMEQLQIRSSGDLALAHWLNKCGEETPEGTEDKCGYMRVTVGYERRNGQWKVVHEHWSAPFDMETSKALFDLKP